MSAGTLLACHPGSEAHVTHLSDPELVRRTLQGDTTAFGTLVERYKQVVYGVCVSLLGDFALAQDLAQDAFLKAFQHVHRLAMPERFGNWLCIIARNECRLYLRQAHATGAPGRGTRSTTRRPRVRPISCRQSSSRSCDTSRTTTSDSARQRCKRCRPCQKRTGRCSPSTT